MNKKFLIFGISAIVLLTASFFFIKNSQILTTNKSIPDIDNQLRNNIVEIEKNLVLLELNDLTFDDFKNKTNSFIHSYYSDSYFEGKEHVYNDISLLVISTETPIYQYISKVYSSDDNSVKQIYVKSSVFPAIDLSTQKPIEGTGSQVVRLYIFKKENEQWKIISDKSNLVSVARSEPKQIIEKFVNHNNIPIEYEYMKILE